MMTKTRSMTRNQNYDASSTKRIESCDSCGVAPWSELNHDVLFLVMMRLGVFDFPAFSGVCKSWRSLALTNKNKFITSRPPMSISFPTDDDNDKECNLEDFEERKFKIHIPHSDGTTCVGLTCGYLVFYGEKTNDFWLVNPFTRHQLHFPCVPLPSHVDAIQGVRAILVVSLSMKGWVLFLLNRYSGIIKFSILGEGTWYHVYSIFPIKDLHVFKGKIYALNGDWRLCELRLNPEPKLTLLETENFPEALLLPEFVSTGESLCLMQYMSRGLFLFHELDFDKMKWVRFKETRKEYAFFHNNLKNIVAVKRESWASTGNRRKHRFYDAKMWYFPHDCLNVNRIDE